MYLSQVYEGNSISFIYGTVSKSDTGPLNYGSDTRSLDIDSRGLVPDHKPCLSGLSRGPVVCETTTDKSRDTGPYLHVYVVTVILPTKTHVEVSLCFVRHL